MFFFNKFKHFTYSSHENPTVIDVDYFKDVEDNVTFYDLFHFYKKNNPDSHICDSDFFFLLFNEHVVVNIYKPCNSLKYDIFYTLDSNLVPIVIIE